MRRFRFIFVPPGPTRMCVYKGFKGRIRKYLKEKGTKWPWDFSLESRPIWCGWTTLGWGAYKNMGAFTFYDRKGRVFQCDGSSRDEVCAAAWAGIESVGWGSGVMSGVQAWIQIQDQGGGNFHATLTEHKVEAMVRMDYWYDEFPGVQPYRMKWTFGVDQPYRNAGELQFIDLGLIIPMDSATITGECTCYDITFPDGWWHTKMQPYPPSLGYCCSPHGGTCNKGANISQYTARNLEIWGGPTGWEYIDIPDWIFDSPGKYWLAMVDTAGNMMPGPYLPLK